MSLSNGLMGIALDEFFGWSINDSRIFYKRMRELAPILILFSIVFSTGFSECPDIDTTPELVPNQPLLRRSLNRYDFPFYK